MDSQNSPDQGFESVRLALDLFDDRTGSGYRAISLNDTRERLKTRDGTGVQVDDRLIISSKLLGDFIRRWRGHENSSGISNFLKQTLTSVRRCPGMQRPNTNRHHIPGLMPKMPSRLLKKWFECFRCARIKYERNQFASDHLEPCRQDSWRVFRVDA